MSPELERRLINRWPGWFRTDADIRVTLMPLGFQCGNGWFDLLWRLCADLEPLVARWKRDSKCDFEVLEVKEKLGGLRLYANANYDAILRRIETATSESRRTCEVCGQPGHPREEDRIATLCDSCALAQHS